MASAASRETSLTRSGNASPALSAGSAPEKQESLPAAYTGDKTEDSSKLKTFLSILRKFIGISDLAAVRFSLPAQLLEPTPNLEYWNYLDRPETFVAIGDSEDALGRMLEVLRFWFTKDLKYVKGRPCKPYNSVLGEFFRCNWEVEDSVKPVSEESRKESTQQHIDTEGKKIRISYLTEQTSHHPPVSAYYVDCPVKGVSARGFDQLSAKFTGTSIRVIPGNFNHGIFINIERRDNEEYQLTHPIAHLSGIIRGSLSVTVADTCYITCPKTKQKAILEYIEEGWLGKAQNKMKGVIFTYDPENDTVKKLRDVPEKDILATLQGSWHEEITYTPAGSKDPLPLIDLRPLFPSAKIVPPLSSQSAHESLKFWSAVTAAIKEKRYPEATRLKQEIEEKQREKVKERESKKEEFQPVYFTKAVEEDGRPSLNDEGKRVLQLLQECRWDLDDSPGAEGAAAAGEGGKTPEEKGTEGQKVETT